MVTHTQVISNSFFEVLQEAADKVGVKLQSEVEWKTLGEVSFYYDGTHQTPKYVDKGVPFVSVQDIKNIYGTKKYISKEDFEKFKVKPAKGDLFMTRIGDIGTCAIIQNNDDLAYYVTLALIKPKSSVVDTKFLKYIIESEHGKKELSRRILHNATPIKINLGDIGKLKFPLPSLEVQKYIVEKLDKFDTLVHDITQGLPKEIELREKQYIYYRERLLNFSKED